MGELFHKLFAYSKATPMVSKLNKARPTRIHIFLENGDFFLRFQKNTRPHLAYPPTQTFLGTRDEPQRTSTWEATRSVFESFLPAYMETLKR